VPLAPAIAERFPGVVFHTGNSHQLLPRVLAAFTEAERNVDFVLVDGDHSTDGVRRDLEDLLASPAVGSTVMLIHDTMNDFVRAGVEAALARSGGRAEYVDLDFVPGYMVREGPFRHELWGGLGLVITSPDGRCPRPVQGSAFFDAHRLVRPMRDAIVATERSLGPGGEDLLAAAGACFDPALRERATAAVAEAARQRQTVETVLRSHSWRLTAPLRRCRAGLDRLLSSARGGGR
jgi:hypothetical protein